MPNPYGRDWTGQNEEQVIDRFTYFLRKFPVKKKLYIAREFLDAIEQEALDKGHGHNE